MPDIVIPGEQLEQTEQALTRTLDFIKSERIPGDLNRILGDGPLADAARNFDSRWADGREQLERQCTDVRKAIDQIMDGFGQTDTQSSESLQAVQG